MGICAWILHTYPQLILAWSTRYLLILSLSLPTSHEIIFNSLPRPSPFHSPPNALHHTHTRPTFITHLYLLRYLPHIYFSISRRVRSVLISDVSLYHRVVKEIKNRGHLPESGRRAGGVSWCMKSRRGYEAKNEHSSIGKRRVN